MVSTGSRNRRERRIRSERVPGVLVTPAVSAERPVAPVEHGSREVALNWRMFSGLIIAGLLLVLVVFFSTEVFYVRSISVSGVRYLQSAEIFRWTDIADSHIFWVNPQDVRRRILQFPAVADAQVSIGWPPNMVRIAIVERQPAVIWEQAGVSVWVDIHGNVLMFPPEERPDLIRIEAIGVDEPLANTQRIDKDVVSGARQLRELIPSTSRLRYDRFYGLGFDDPGGWVAWFGSGLDMPTKIRIYRALVDELGRMGVTPSLISVADPDKPHYCERPTGC